MANPRNNMHQQKRLERRAADDVEILRSFFIYTALIENVASGSQGSDNVQIQSDADFMIHQMTGWAVANNVHVSDPYATFQLTDNSSGMNLFDGEIPFASALGTGQLPFILPVPRLLSANSLLTVNVTNINSAAATTFYFNFIGTKLYKLG